jgi:hypothetical protein
MREIYRVLKKESNEYIAIVLMILFILSNAKVPNVLGNLIDTLMGRVMVIGLALSLLFVHTGLGVVSLIFAYELIRRSEKSTGTYQMRHYLPSFEKRDSHLSAMNQFPVTLEEELVYKMVPLVSGPPSSSKFKPVMSNLHQAAKL